MINERSEPLTGTDRALGVNNCEWKLKKCLIPERCQAAAGSLRGLVCVGESEAPEPPVQTSCHSHLILSLERLHAEPFCKVHVIVIATLTRRPSGNEPADGNLWCDGDKSPTQGILLSLRTSELESTHL